jgi:hypothetical protein
MRNSRGDDTSPIGNKPHLQISGYATLLISQEDVKKEKTRKLSFIDTGNKDTFIIIVGH